MKTARGIAAMLQDEKPKQDVKRQLETIRGYIATYWEDHHLNMAMNTEIQDDADEREIADCLDAIRDVLAS